MGTVVITGSARGLGLEMAKEFLRQGKNVVISDVNEANLKMAEGALMMIQTQAKFASHICNVTNVEDIKGLITFAKEKFETIDIWINNAGVNQPEKAIWELEDKDINFVIDVDLKGTIMCSKYVMQEMEKQKSGAIYNVEGYGSNEAKMLGLSIYGTSKRAITYFSDALAKENETRQTGVIVGKLSPGIMITDFLTNAVGDKEKITLSDKTKKVYNILGDYPDVIAKYMVDQMIKNKKNYKRISWLTNSKASLRFMTCAFNKRDFFKALDEPKAQ